MPSQTNIAYLYDGSFNGFLCCVYESFYKREMPIAIFDYTSEQATIFTQREIVTNLDHASRVESSIAKKISMEALELVRLCFLSSLENKEVSLIKFLRLGYKVGGKVVDMLAHEAVQRVTQGVKAVAGEAHLFKGFLRFSDFNGALAAVFEPKHFVLPIIGAHFCDRFPGEEFLIYDKTHNYVFMHKDGVNNMFPVEYFEMPTPSEEELAYRAMWKRFYNTIAIEGRINPKLRANNMPLRYRTHMTEFL